MMFERQVVNETGERRQSTLEPAPNRLQLAKEPVFKLYLERVGDAIDRVEREHDARQLEQVVLVSDTIRGRGYPGSIDVCEG